MKKIVLFIKLIICFLSLSIIITCAGTEDPYAIMDVPQTGDGDVPANSPPTVGETLTCPEAGVTFIRKWGTGGSSDGEFNIPIDVALDSGNNVYVVDMNNARIQKFDSNGNFITKWGSDGYGTYNSEFHYPQGIAITNSDEVFVSNYWGGLNPTDLKRFDSDGNLIQAFDGWWNSNWGLREPSGMAFYSSASPLFTYSYSGTHSVYNVIYLADRANCRIMRTNSDDIAAPNPTLLHMSQKLRDNTPFGGGIYGTCGSADGYFDQPHDVSVDSSNGDVYVADTGNNRIQKFDINGNYLLKWGVNGTGNSEFNKPKSVLVDSNSDILVADTGNNRIQKFDSAGNYILEWSCNGELNSPRGLTIDSSGRIYVADTGNHRILVFDVP